MGVFTLGLMKGMGDRVVQHYDAQARAKAEQEKLDKQLENERKLAEFRAEKEKENLTFRVGAETQQQMATLAYQEQAATRQQSARIKEESAAKIAEKEAESARVFGVRALDGPKAGQIVSTDYDGQTRPLDFVEINERIEEMREEDPTRGIALPASYQISQPKTDKATEVRTPFATVTFTDQPIENGPLVERTAQFKPVDKDQFPNNPVSFAQANFLETVGTLSRNPALMKKLREEGPNGPHVKQILGGLKKYVTTKDFVKALSVGPSANKDGLVIANPFGVSAFKGSNFFDNEEDANFYELAILRPLVNASEDTVKRMRGVAKQIKYSYDASNNFIEPDSAKWKWATIDDPTGQKVLDPVDHQRAIEIGKLAGMSDLDILGIAGSTGKGEAVFDMLYDRREEFANVITRNDVGVILPTSNLQNFLTETLSESGIGNVDDQIRFVQAFMNAPAVTRPERVVSGASGELTIVGADASYKKMYGITPKEYAKRAQAAKRAKELATKAMELLQSGQADVTIVGSLIKTLGGAQDIGRSLANLAASYNFGSEEQQKQFLENSRQITEAVNKGGMIEGNKLLDLLSVQLGYALASAYQGGGEGRAISDADVKLGLQAAGLDRKLTSNNPGAISNLKAIISEMSKSEAVYRNYGIAQGKRDFEAVYMYDQMVSDRVQDLNTLAVQSLGRFGFKEEEQANVEVVEETTAPNGTKIKRVAKPAFAK